MGTILLIILILVLIGALPTWPYSSGWGYYPSGGLGLVLLILIILLVMGRIWRSCFANDSWRDFPASDKEWVHLLNKPIKTKGGRKMKTGLKVSSVVLAALLVISGCTSMTGQTAGQFSWAKTQTKGLNFRLGCFSSWVGRILQGKDFQHELLSSQKV